MDKQPLISICIPTNGVSEWVFPALDSIYEQGIEEELYEVVITDNGNNPHFKNLMRTYMIEHENIVYEETETLPFMNEIEAYKRANGQLIKYSNHRNIYEQGALGYLIEFANKYKREKPIVYFSNGVLDIDQDQLILSDFDEFVRGLSYWSSWSSGMTIWREDFYNLIKTKFDYNELFPHTDILFSDCVHSKYIIDNKRLFHEVPAGTIPKGNYDLFYAFGIEYPRIIESMYSEGNISKETYKHVLDKNLEFISTLYWDYCIRKRPCSYNLNGIKKMYNNYYTRIDLYKKIIFLFGDKCKRKALNVFKTCNTILNL